MAARAGGAEARTSMVGNLRSLEDLAAPAGDTPAALAQLLFKSGRNAFLAELVRRGVGDLGRRSALTDALDAAVRGGQLEWDTQLSEEFELAAQSMPPIVRQLLVDNADPKSVPVAELLEAIGRDLSSCEGGVVMEVPAALSPRACAVLRSAVDCDRRLSRDSVDGGPEHQLNLSLDALELLIGRAEVDKLMRLPRDYRRRSALAAPSSSSPTAPLDASDADAAQSAHALRERAAALRAEAISRKRAGDAGAATALLQEAKAVASAATAAEDGAAPSAPCDDGGSDDDERGAAAASAGAAELREMFVRRYSVDTRPWIPFHPDAYELTVNIALSADDAHGGGTLLGVYDGRVQALTRGEGGATCHSSSLLHAVSRMTTGTRYSLICFFDRRERAGRQNRWTRAGAPSAA